MAGGAQNKTQKQGKQLGKMSHEIELENVGKEMKDHSGNDPPFTECLKMKTISMSCKQEFRSTDRGP